MGQIDSMQLICRHLSFKSRAGTGVAFGVRGVSAASVAVLAIMAWPSELLAQSSAASNEKLRTVIERREKARASLESNRKYLSESRERAESIREAMSRLKQERAKLNADLISTGDQVKNTEAKMTAIEGRLGKLERQEQALRTNLQSQHKSIGRLLAAIQRIGRNPPPVMITRRSDALAMVRSAMLLARAFPKLRGEALILSAKLNRLVTLMSGIRQESDKLRAEAETLQNAQTRLSKLMQTKRQSLGNRRVELAEVKRTVKVIGQNVDSLEELIRRLGPAISRETRIGRQLEVEARRRAIAEAEAETRAVAAAREKKYKELQVALNVPKPFTPPAGKPNVVKPAVVRPPAANAIQRPPSIDLAPKGGAFIGNSARIAPAIPFHRAKGQLPMPAAGRVETNFGQQTKFGGRSKGLVIQTRHGAQVTSPSDGWVVYAGKFRTYGQLLIIKAGNGYHVLLAGLSRIDVQSGQFVLAAEPVGTMKKAPGRRIDQNSPRLYVEFRKDGRPINPRPWWSASTKQRVQG